MDLLESQLNSLIKSSEERVKARLEEKKENVDVADINRLSKYVIFGKNTRFLTNMDEFEQKQYEYINSQKDEESTLRLEQEIYAVVRNIKEKWDFDNFGTKCHDEFIKLLEERSGINEDEDLLNTIIENSDNRIYNENQIMYKMEMFTFYEISQAVRCISFLSDEEEKTKLREEMDFLSGILYSLYSSYKCLRTAHYKSKNLFDDGINFNIIGSRFMRCNNNPTLTNFSTLLSYIEFKINEWGFKLCKEYLYSPYYTKEGYFTHSWKKTCTITEFINEICSRKYNPEMWALYESNGTMAKSIENRCLESQSDTLKDMKSSRYAFAYRNGIHHINVISNSTYDQSREYPCEDDRLHDRKTIVVDRFYKYGTPEFKKNIRSNLVCNNYHDMDFEYIDITWPIPGSGPTRRHPDFDSYKHAKMHDEWFTKIKTPNFQKIPSYQFSNEDEEISADETDGVRKNWLSKYYCILHGKVLYNTGSHDDWSIIPMIIGEAQTGKSTTGDVFNMIYPPDKIGRISNTINSRFGLESLYDKYINIAHDINSSFSGNQTDIQSMASGEGMSVEPKGKKSINLEMWLPSVIMYGNELPGNYKDMSGAISRRLVAEYFRNRLRPEDIDNDLKSKLYKEISYIIQKFARAYLFTRILYMKDFWAFCPNYFMENRIKLESRASSLVEFLKSEYVKIGKGHCIPWMVFKKKYNTFCKVNRSLVLLINEDTYTSPFKVMSNLYCKELDNENICVVENGNYIYPTVLNPIDDQPPIEKNGKFIVGIDIDEKAFINLN